MLRVPARDFRPARAQRRCRSRNTDISVETGPPEPTEEKYDLYRLYLEQRHDRLMAGTREEFQDFLYSSPTETIEIRYRLGDRLIGVGITDVEPKALSAVFCYFDPAESRRSIGVFNVLTLIDEAEHRSVPCVYLGYYVRDCPSMSYKAAYRPCEILQPGGRWARFEPGDTISGTGSAGS
jgi:arginine-tRNA-protein transferase